MVYSIENKDCMLHSGNYYPGEKSICEFLILVFEEADDHKFCHVTITTEWKHSWTLLTTR